jgi:hypothetical protein
MRTLRLTADHGRSARGGLEGQRQHGRGADGRTGAGGPRQTPTAGDHPGPTPRPARPPDALKRDFTPPEKPIVAWCGDLTEIPTDEAGSTSPRSSTCTRVAAPGSSLGPITTLSWSARHPGTGDPRLLPPRHHRWFAPSTSPPAGSTPNCTPYIEVASSRSFSTTSTGRSSTASRSTDPGQLFDPQDPRDPQLAATPPLFVLHFTPTGSSWLNLAKAGSASSPTRSCNTRPTSRARHWPTRSPPGLHA